jgi:hypothetical protein
MKKSFDNYPYTYALHYMTNYKISSCIPNIFYSHGNVYNLPALSFLRDDEWQMSFWVTNIHHKGMGDYITTLSFDLVYIKIL